MPIGKMRQFSIKELERFSNIKAHTIRIWENRYAVFKPQRNANNIRNYSLNDVKLLLNISLLLEDGARISQLTKLGAAEIERKAMDSGKTMPLKIVHSLIVCMYSNNFYEFEHALDNCVNTFGIDTTIQKVLIPFLEKVDILSYKDSRHEVHFAVTAVRKKLITGIESIKIRPGTANVSLLFLPKGEHYDLLLLYMTYVMKGKGIPILYLGTNIPIENLQQVILEMKPANLFTYLPANFHFDIPEFANFLSRNIPKAQLFIAEPEYMVRKPTGRNTRFFYYRDIATVVDPHTAY